MSTDSGVGSSDSEDDFLVKLAYGVFPRPIIQSKKCCVTISHSFEYFYSFYLRFIEKQKQTNIEVTENFSYDSELNEFSSGNPLIMKQMFLIKDNAASAHVYKFLFDPS